MEFYSGFKWAVPTAFSDAILQCRFEKGDILYDTPKAYDGEWQEAAKHIEYSLQVLYPPTDMSRAESDIKIDKSRVFPTNWRSKVIIELYKHLQKIGTEPIETTQGRLYTALWKGDIEVLNLNNEEPKIPFTVTQVTREFLKNFDPIKVLSNKNPTFVMARDLPNPTSREKYFKILSQLRPHLASEPKVLDTQSAGLNDWENIVPTIEIACFITTGISKEMLHDLVKQAVYKKTENSEEDKFRISAHGVIF